MLSFGLDFIPIMPFECLWNNLQVSKKPKSLLWELFCCHWGASNCFMHMPWIDVALQSTSDELTSFDVWSNVTYPHLHKQTLNVKIFKKFSFVIHHWKLQALLKTAFLSPLIRDVSIFFCYPKIDLSPEKFGVCFPYNDLRIFQVY